MPRPVVPVGDPVHVSGRFADQSVDDAWSVDLNQPDLVLQPELELHGCTLMDTCVVNRKCLFERFEMILPQVPGHLPKELVGILAV